MTTERAIGKITDSGVQDLKNRIGSYYRGGSTILQVSGDVIRKYALSNGDRNPLYLDEEYAKKSRYGGIIAPPTMIFEMNHNIGAEIGEEGSAADAFGRLPPPFRSVIRGGNEYEFCQPVRPGDIITTRQKIAEIYERSGKGGTMVFVVNELTYYNQRGEKLGVNREAVIYPYQKRKEGGA